MNGVKTIVAVIVLLFLSSCQEDHNAVLHNPKVSDLEGIWEGVSFLPVVDYGLIKFSSTGVAKFVAGMENEVGVVGELDGFESREHDFRIRLTLVDDDGKKYDEDAMFLRGVIKTDQLCFYFEEEQGDQIEVKACFIKLEKAADLRSKALKLLGVDVNHQPAK